MIQKLAFLFFFLIVSSRHLLASEDPAIGKKFFTLDELVKDQRAAGFELVDKFGTSWPATVETVHQSMNEIELLVPDEGLKQYSGFDGFELKSMHLFNSWREENVAVFRSATRKTHREKIQEPEPEEWESRVTQVLDPVSLRLSNGERVRLSGVELSTKDINAASYRQVMQFLQREIENQEVLIKRDPAYTLRTKDADGEKRVYVFRKSDGMNINRLIQERK